MELDFLEGCAFFNGSSSFFCASKFGLWEVWLVQTHGEPMKGLNFRRKKKYQFFIGKAKRHIGCWNRKTPTCVSLLHFCKYWYSGCQAYAYNIVSQIHYEIHHSEFQALNFTPWTREPKTLTPEPESWILNLELCHLNFWPWTLTPGYTFSLQPDTNPPSTTARFSRWKV